MAACVARFLNGELLFVVYKNNNNNNFQILPYLVYYTFMGGIERFLWD